MKCSDAQLSLLEAEPSTLDGSDGTPLAQHLAGCSHCSARAQAILQAETLLASALTEEVPLPDLDRIITAGMERDVSPLQPKWKNWNARRPGSALIPLAAAAVLAALFLGRPPSLPGPEYTPRPQDNGLAVEVPLGQSVAVMETNNPEITVLWLF